MRIIILFLTAGALVLSGATVQAADTPGQVLTQKTAQETTTTITCFQNGRQVIHEENLRNYRPGQSGLFGKRPDGTWVSITGVDGDSGTVCKILDEPDQSEESG